jgi:phosphoserine phosphatase RsbU/P
MITVSPLMEERASEKARQADLEEARAIQDAMLPSEALTAGAVTVTHKFQPVDAVGGDFLDYFRLADESVGMYLGDVCGKGLPAAMYGALAVGILRGVHKTGQPPHTILSTLNSRLTGRAGMRRHVAVTYGMFDPRTLEMQISSAGMPAVLHFTEGEYRTVELTGIPPGLFAHAEYETATVQLQPGDSILMCSDGIVEAQCPL